MKAALMRSPGRLDVTEVKDLGCPPGGALLKVLACAVCGTDVKMLEHGHHALRYPRIPGHEVTAEIVELDDTSGNLRPGDRVQVWPGESCGRCQHCLSGNDHLCPDIGIMGFSMDGGMAEELAIKNVSRLMPIGDADPSLLTLAEPLACCINAQDKLTIAEGDTVLVLGGGPMGCINAKLARSRGARKVLVTEPEQQRLRTVPKGLFDRISSPDDPSIRRMVDEETSGGGVDIIIPCTPNVRLDRGLFELMAPGGRLCVFSGPRKDDSPIMVDVRDMHYRELMLVGSYGQSSRHDRTAVEMLCRGEMDLAWLLTGKYSLDRTADAFKHVSSREGLKAIIKI
ncbi:MAG: alcohol dehydrogenase catalytic domain-containing protein [Methanomassiliicoccales archaeon]|nr:alcohol dehydrogenase catalytic domain-containing protein [Methanomassiliicoccales archaeon]